tara:strand:+ start:311 stop:574 length:264 start_codon:yes stop_codon:yes gene_type:complete
MEISYQDILIGALVTLLCYALWRLVKSQWLKENKIRVMLAALVSLYIITLSLHGHFEIISLFTLKIVSGIAFFGISALAIYVEVHKN